MVSKRGIRVTSQVAIGTIVVVTVIATAVTVAQPTPQPNQSIVVGAQGVGTGGQFAEVGPDGFYTRHRSDAGSYHDVTVINDTHWLATYANKSGETGFRVIGPDGIEREWAIQVADWTNSEIHDAELLPNGRILVADMDRERLVDVAPNGSVVWTWNATQHYTDHPDNILHTDWLHINDVDRIGAGRYLVSVRNTNQLLVIERGAGVAEVINEDHNPNVLRRQHNPQWLGDGRVLVADSENRRVVELQRQPNGTWTVAWAVDDAAGEGFLWPRDADRLANGNTLITDSRNHRVVLVDENGIAIAEWRTPKLPYDAEMVDGRTESVGGPTHEGIHTSDRFEGPALLRGLVIGMHHGIGLPSWVAWWHLAAILLAIAVQFGADMGILVIESGLWDGDSPQTSGATTEVTTDD
jgi:hypothetical protein